MADNDKLSQNGREESETEEKIIREMEAQKTENSAEEASVFSDLLHSMGFTKRQSDEKVLQEELENYERQLEQQAEPTEKIDLSQITDDEEIELSKTPQRRKWPLVMLGAFLLAGAGAVSYYVLPVLTEPKPPAPDVVGSYNGKNITIDELTDFIAVEGVKEREHMLCPIHGYDHSKCDLSEECESHPIDSLEGYRQMVSRLASEQMILDWAKEQGITGREEVKHNMEDLLNDATVEQYMTQLHEENVSPESIPKLEVQQYYSENQNDFEGKTFDQVEDEIRQILAAEKDGSFFEAYIEDLKKTSGLQVNFEVLEVTPPTKDAVENYYNENKENYVTKPSVEYSEIRIAAVNAKTATQAVRKIRSGESFESVAVSFAENKEVINNTSEEDRDTVLDKTISKMIEGDISDPVENEDGSISIVRLDKRIPEGIKPLSEVQKEIEVILQQENMDAEYQMRENETLFVVHSRRYTLGDFYKEFKELSKNYQSQLATFEAKKKLVEQMIAKELLLENSTDEADDGENSHSFEELQTQYLWQVMHQEEVDTNLAEPTEEEIQKYYEENKESLMTPASVELNLIWISQGENGEKREQAKAKGEEALGMLENGKDFAEVAKQYSEDPSAENGGQISGTLYEDHLAEPLAEAAFSMKEGEYSSLIEYQNAFYIIQLRSMTEEELRPLEELANGIKLHLKEQAHEQLSEDLSQKILDKAGFQIYDRTLKKLLTKS